jgi:hypothetical protein
MVVLREPFDGPEEGRVEDGVDTGVLGRHDRSVTLVEHYFQSPINSNATQSRGCEWFGERFSSICSAVRKESPTGMQFPQEPRTPG